MKRITFILFIAISIFICQIVHGQSTLQLIKKGNEIYSNYGYNYAEEFFQDAINEDANNLYPEAIYNLANSLFMQKKYKQAALQFISFTFASHDEEQQSMAYYNLGNCYFIQEKYELSIQSYQHALKLNPDDEDARYNLVLAESKLEATKQKSEAEKNKEDQKQLGKFQLPNNLPRNKNPLPSQPTHSDLENIHGKYLSEEMWKEILKTLTIDESETITQLQAIQNEKRRKRILKDW